MSKVKQLLHAAPFYLKKTLGLANSNDVAKVTKNLCGVPGVVLGVSRNGKRELGSAGCRNLNTNEPMTPDTLFLTGSITKIWTTVLFMTFVEEGQVNLNDPVRKYLPNFKVADPEVSENVKVIHLLNHTTGWDAGDMALELGEGSVAVAKTLEILATTEQVYPLGEYSSYNNSNYVVQAAIMETLDGGGEFTQLLKSRIIEPLGLKRTFTNCDDAIRYKTAIGSLATGENGELEATEFTLLPKSMAAAGSVLWTTVDDTLTFFEMLLNDGVGNNGVRILTEATVRQMESITTPKDKNMDIVYGLGLAVRQQSDDENDAFYFHTGGSYGGNALAAYDPKEKIAFIAFSNAAARGAAAVGVALNFLPNSRMKMEAPKVPESNESIDLEPVIGKFRRCSMLVEISKDPNAPGELQLSVEMNYDEFQVDPSYGEMQPSDGAAQKHSIGKPAAKDRPLASAQMYDLDENNQYKYLFLGGRMHKRV